MLGRRRLDLLVILWICNLDFMMLWWGVLVLGCGFTDYLGKIFCNLHCFSKIIPYQENLIWILKNLRVKNPSISPPFHFWQLSLCFTIVHKWLWKPLSIMFKNKISNICFNLILYYKIYHIHVHVYLNVWFKLRITLSEYNQILKIWKMNFLFH